MGASVDLCTGVNLCGGVQVSQGACTCVYMSVFLNVHASLCMCQWPTCVCSLSLHMYVPIHVCSCVYA